MLLQPKSFVEPDRFYCRGRGKRLSIHDCMAKFVDANALGWKENPCFKCTQGQDNRVGYAKS